MVSWIRMYPDGSGHVGTVSAYGRIVTTNPTLPKRALFLPTAVILSSPGTVDTNAPTRAQYATLMGLPLFSATAALRFTADDVSAAPGRALTATMFMAPASAFAPGAVPTPSQIRLAATRVVRGTGQLGSPDSRTTAGDLNYLDMRTEAFTAEQPNTKLWLAVIPTSIVAGSTPSIANDVPVGDANVNGRAVSLWTNRTPLAPVITAPSGTATAFSGQTVVLKFEPRDPDRIVSFPGDAGLADFDDMAGVQFQYRRRPTEADPNTVWADLPIADLTGASYGQGWYIDRIPVVAGPGGNEGAYYKWKSRTLAIRCGNVAGLTAGAAELEPGDWEVRLRTFDYGHGWSDADNLTVSPPGTPGEPPLADALHSYTPNNYPAVNTSPWSEPLRIIISPQVPKPVPLSPIGDIAVMEDTEVTLSWRYRNTYSPPYEQARRIVQIRHIYETGWFTLIDDMSDSTETTIAAGALDSGNQYAWRVQVQDAGGEFSEYSDEAYFWVVPKPDSGTVIPDPSESIDGATLGCGTHHVLIYTRGGTNRVGEIRGFSSMEWNRVRDDMSTSKIVVRDWGVDCGNLLSTLEPWAHEVVIFRDNGYGVERVWEGPITLLTYENDAVTIHAKDVMAYAYRRIIKQKMSDVADGATVTARAARVLQNTLAADDPNVLAYMHVLAQPDDAMQYRSTPAYGRTAFEEVDDMAANAGLDYTAIGRSILLWGTKHRIGTLPEFRDKDLGASPIVSVYGMSMANVYAVSDGNGIWGEATRLNSEGKDPVYGLVEMLSSTWASDSATDTGTYTEAGLNTMRESFAEAAERSIASRYPAPVVVRVPDNTRLNPDTVISIQHLVPGVVIPLRSTSTLREVVASQKLDAVKVVETGGEETITITMSPFSRDDNAVEGGEEG